MSRAHRWGDWLFVFGLVLAIVVAVADRNGRDPLLPPILATIFAAAFAMLISDGYRTGRIRIRFQTIHRDTEPRWFNSAIAAYAVFGLLSLGLAIALWRDLFLAR